MKAKIAHHQLRHIQNCLDMSSEQVENLLLEKWDVLSLDDLNYTDYDDIIVDIMDINNEIRKENDFKRRKQKGLL